MRQHNVWRVCVAFYVGRYVGPPHMECHQTFKVGLLHFFIAMK